MRYLPGLGTLRIYAAFSVLLGHIDQLRTLWPNPGSIDNPLAFINQFFPKGSFAVTLFFVLSGYLIMSLLLHDQQTRGQVDVRRFYIRRALRILPLYFLFVGVTWLVLPQFDPGMLATRQPLMVLSSLTFTSNIVPLPVPLGHLWTIATEEQFYLLVPLLFLRPVSEHRLYAMLLLVIIVRLVVAVLTAQFISPALPPVLMMRFECMAVGCLLAALMFYREPTVSRYLTSRWIRIGLAVLIVLQLAGNWESDQVLIHFLAAFMYGVLIINMTCGKFLTFETPLMRSLGNLSYAIYLLHPLLVFVLVRALQPATIWLYLMSIILTLALASLSYTTLERSFLRMRPT